MDGWMDDHKRGEGASEGASFPSDCCSVIHYKRIVSTVIVNLKCSVNTETAAAAAVAASANSSKRRSGCWLELSSKSTLKYTLLYFGVECVLHLSDSFYFSWVFYQEVCRLEAIKSQWSHSPLSRCLFNFFFTLHSNSIFWTTCWVLSSVFPLFKWITTDVSIYERPFADMAKNS